MEIACSFIRYCFTYESYIISDAGRIHYNEETVDFGFAPLLTSIIVS